MNLALSEIGLPVRLRFERSLTARKSVGLIDPIDKAVTIYGPGTEPEHLFDPTSVRGTGPIAGFELVMQRVWG